MRGPILFAIASVAFGIVFFSIETYSQEAYGLEENFVTLQTGIISTQDGDFAISNEFEIRILKNENIMRLSGVTTTGESYYVYQKTIDNEIILKGKILLDGTFVSIIQKDVIPESVIETQTQVQEPIKMVINQPHSTYWRQDYTINIKTFEADRNPSNDYWYKEYLVSNVPILVNITHENGNHLATIEGNTNENGYFQGSHYIIENLVQAGKYFVHVVAGDEKSGDVKDLTTFVIAEVIGIRGSDNNPISDARFNPAIPTHPSVVNLIGSGSFDPNGIIVSYLWTQTGGPVALPAVPTNADTTFTTNGAGTYTYRLDVTDDSGNNDSSSIAINVI